MLNRSAAFILAAAIAVLSAPAVAASLPAIKTTSSNQVPACITPGRLTAFLKSRYSSLPSKFDKIGMYYMRHGEDLGVRWDMAFYQMVVETNSLKYTGDVLARQNNFAGLGATGGGVKGEYFKTVEDGVRAHLEHVLMYTGTHIDNPVAERTRKVQEWKVIVPYRRSIRGPMTFTHLGRKWAPSDRGYSDDIQAISNEFDRNFCNAPDPRPELVAMARGNKAASTQTATNTLAPPSTNKTKVAASTNTPAKTTTSNRSALGAGSLIGLSQSAQTAKDMAAKKTPDLINPSAKKSEPTKTAMAPSGISNADLKPATGKCRVWTASYGGAKAIIIKAPGNGMTNFTVLDVHAGKEKREADAYIAAYAKGGKTIGEFPSPTAALDKAFELCPEK
ncbi:MAG: glucosaminidase domain-containing protein [Alphaproteobacteria bacterium]|nr:glucosaminidase domain-containing protein [Alphaproteobacteria bacterium]